MDTNFELEHEDMSRFYFREGHCTVACIGMIIKNKQDIRIEKKFWTATLSVNYNILCISCDTGIESVSSFV